MLAFRLDGGEEAGVLDNSSKGRDEGLKCTMSESEYNPVLEKSTSKKKKKKNRTYPDWDIVWFPRVLRRGAGGVGAG